MEATFLMLPAELLWSFIDQDREIYPLLNQLLEVISLSANALISFDRPIHSLEL